VRAAARVFFLVLLLAMTVAGAAAPGVGAEVVDVPPPTDCGKYELAPDGSRRQTFDAFSPSSGIAALPPRTITKLLPGDTNTFCIGFQNRGDKPVDLELDVADVTADENGLPSSQRDAEDRGASRWVTLPTERIDQIKSGDVAWLQVVVHVPDDAVAGSSYASVVATDRTPLPSEKGTQVQSIPSVASQLFFDIPGDAVRRGAVTDIKSPRVIWWDGLGMGDLPVLDRLRGLGVATIHFTWNNEGDFTSDIGGSLNITSDLSDRSVTKIPVVQSVVLAGSERDFDVTWKRDIPLLGRFTPVLEVRGDSGKVERHELEPIWVIPSWWYLVLLALAIGLPLWWRRRSAQRYEELLARVEAGESRTAGDDFDEDAWDQDEDWEPGP
jgi:hypothetical protein